MLDPFRWDARYQTGIPLIDAQHHALVDRINRFGHALALEQPPEPVVGLLADLADYAELHFHDEEAVMQAAAIDPRHARGHIAQHRDFSRAVGAMRAGAQSSADHETVGRFLVHWLGTHILGTDQALARQLHAIEGGATAARAFDEAAPEVDGTSAGEPLVDALLVLYGEVAARNRSLTELNRSLEAIVEERTAALTEANRQLERIAMTDVLTGLPNRRQAIAALESGWASPRPLACLLLDADGFKQVNDRWGHDAGDVVLRRLADALRRAVRTDDLVCRLGGDEFLVICSNTPLRGALQVADAVLAEVRALRVPTGDGAWTGSVSIGVAERVPADADVEALLKAADEALYEAKARGRNRAASAGR